MFCFGIFFCHNTGLITFLLRPTTTWSTDFTIHSLDVVYWGTPITSDAHTHTHTRDSPQLEEGTSDVLVYVKQMDPPVSDLFYLWFSVFRPNQERKQSGFRFLVAPPATDSRKYFVSCLFLVFVNYNSTTTDFSGTGSILSPIRFNTDDDDDTTIAIFFWVVLPSSSHRGVLEPNSNSVTVKHFLPT